MLDELTATSGEITQWYRDPVSCLQSTVATVLSRAGVDPLAALGAAWEFRYVPGDVRPEEFYWPCRVPGDVARSMLPYLDVTSSWHELSGADPLAPWQDALARGELPIIAVDNFHLPFRPAYHDVHAAHLVVLVAVDREAGTVEVSDAMPPAFRGTLAADDLIRACTSEYPRDDQDRFFSGRPTGGRWLQVRLGTPSPPVTSLTRQGLDAVLTQNMRAFHGAAGPASHWVGTAGLRRYRELLARAVNRTDTDVLGEVYTHGWSQQAQAALHGELLRRCGSRWRLLRLTEAGRRVEHVAHCWTAVRVRAAHWSTSPTKRPDRLLDRLLDDVDRLCQSHDVALAAIADAVTELRA